VQQAEASTVASLAHFDSVVLNALRETESALSTYSFDTDRAQVLETALQSAQKSADQTHQLYTSGRESFISDLDATRTLTQVDAQVAAARSTVAVDRVNLFLALGGGWEEEEPGGTKEGAQGGGKDGAQQAVSQALPQAINQPINQAMKQATKPQDAQPGASQPGTGSRAQQAAPGSGQAAVQQGAQKSE
jgi:hypothetical protein